MKKIFNSRPLMLGAILTCAAVWPFQVMAGEPELLKNLKSEAVVLTEKAKIDTRGRQFTNPGDRTILCRYRPGGCYSTWDSGGYWMPRYQYFAAVWIDGRIRTYSY